MTKSWEMTVGEEGKFLGRRYWPVYRGGKKLVAIALDKQLALDIAASIGMRLVLADSLRSCLECPLREDVQEVFVKAGRGT